MHCPFPSLAQVFVLGSLMLFGCNSGEPSSGESDAAETTAVPVEFEAGKALYDAGCGVCHDSSRDGAPRLGFPPAWSRRLPQGTETLIQHAIEGKGMMPPKGENEALTDQQVADAVRYMIYRADTNVSGSEKN